MAKNNVVHMRDVKGVPKYNATEAAKAAKRARRHEKMRVGGAIALLGVINFIGMIILSKRACQDPRIASNPIYKCSK